MVVDTLSLNIESMVMDHRDSELRAAILPSGVGRLEMTGRRWHNRRHYASLCVLSDWREIFHHVAGNSE
jgi:hypothetical protein